jgi:ppGpp synthetase/RelA/SpoT-type nucleotidyltranferase
MTVPSEIANAFNLAEKYVAYVGKKVRETVLVYCEQHGFAFSGRYKTVESVSEKIETGRFKSWDELDDLFACTIVIPSLRQEEDVLEYLRSQFREIRTSLRGKARKHPNEFRFDATRFVGVLRAPPIEPIQTRPVGRVKFEVQIRSAFEHAWCVSTHDLTYKGEGVEWRHLRLAAQLKAATEQMDSMILGFQATADVIQDQYWPEVQASNVIRSFFMKSVKTDLIPSEVVPSNLQRFSENVVSLLIAASSKEKIKEVAQEATLHLHQEISSLTIGAFPRSISLFQFVFGVLVKKNLIQSLPQHFTPLVTSELEILYPQVKIFSNKFRFKGLPL